MGITESALTGEVHLPEVEIVGTNVPVTTSATTLASRSCGRATRTYPLDRLNVFVNDVPVFGTAGLPVADRTARSLTQDIQVPLVPGRNKIQVSVLNQQGAESLRQTVYTTSTGGLGAQDVYLVAIGVSQYQNRAYNLRFAAKDAADLVNAYKGIAQRRVHAAGARARSHQREGDARGHPRGEGVVEAGEVERSRGRVCRRPRHDRCAAELLLRHA